MACMPCERMAAMAVDKRWIGDPSMSHCKRCHQSWRRQTNACHCVRCCITFGSPSASTRHDPDGPCLTPESLGYESKINVYGDPVWWPAETVTVYPL